MAKKAKKAAKKVVKKTAGKTARKPARKPPRKSAPENQMAAWAQKVARVAALGGDPPCTGVHTSQGDEYPYTRAQEIFKHYHPLMADVGLVMIPGAVRTFRDHRAYRAECEFRIVDTETGWSVSIWSTGLGNNGVWSLQSAMTVAKKQALLLLFQATWPAEFNTIEVDQSDAWQNLWQTSTPREVQTMLSSYFDAVHREIQSLRDALPAKRSSAKPLRKKRKQP
jgi:hypothetical protein